MHTAITVDEFWIYQHLDTDFPETAKANQRFSFAIKHAPGVHDYTAWRFLQCTPMPCLVTAPEVAVENVVCSLHGWTVAVAVIGTGWRMD